METCSFLQLVYLSGKSVSRGLGWISIYLYSSALGMADTGQTILTLPIKSVADSGFLLLSVARVYLNEFSASGGLHASHESALAEFSHYRR